MNTNLINNSKYLRATRCESNETPPIWIMRQAGRYLTEYHDIRKNYNFLDLVRTPELATEVTLLPIRKFGFDAAILFSDILVLCDLFKCDLAFVENQGPVITNVDVDDIINTPINEDQIRSTLSYVTDTIKLLIPELESRNTPLIGFSGAPITIAAYLIEGKSKTNFNKFKQFYYEEPVKFNALLKKISDVIAIYLNTQIESGVHAIQIFDTWASLFPAEIYKEIGIFYIDEIIKKLDKSVPVTVFSKGTSSIINQLSTLNTNVLGIDWQMSMDAAIESVPTNIALQGNLDPHILFASDQIIESAVKDLLNSTQKRPGFIFNLGHGILPNTDPSKVKFVIDLVRDS